MNFTGITPTPDPYREANRLRHLTVLPGGSAPITKRLREKDHPAVVAQESRRIKAAAAIICDTEHPAHADMVAVLDLWAEVGA